jgi:surface antigen/outer membrane murein-binding lipoprotein Lpp
MKCDIFKLYSKNIKTTKLKSQKSKNTSTSALLSRTGRISAAVAFSTLVLLGTIIPGAKADQFDDQINALNSQNADAQSNVDALQSQANSYQDAISKLQAQIDAVMAQIAANEAQQAQLQQEIIAKQQEIDADRGQQASMLAYTEAQKAAFNSQISANSSKIADLRRQQIIANSRYTIGAPGTGVACGGGYPGKWCDIGQDTVIDNWGMYNRECVSYTAFKVHMDFLAGRTSHDMPWWGGYGNANQWDDNARSAGIPVDLNPTPGSIAISNAGAYGHAMYVEQVGTINGQQAIYVSQYNQQLDGRYSEQWRYTTGLVFLHF